MVARIKRGDRRGLVILGAKLRGTGGVARTKMGGTRDVVGTKLRDRWGGQNQTWGIRWVVGIKLGDWRGGKVQSRGDYVSRGENEGFAGVTRTNLASYSQFIIKFKV